MQKNNPCKNTQEDYYKSLNKIMILGLTSMAALGTSMFVIESSKVNASMLLKSKGLFKIPMMSKSTILRSPAFKPKPQPKLPSLNKIAQEKPRTHGSILSSLLRHNSLSPTSNIEKKLPIKTPTGIKLPDINKKNSPR